MLSAIGLLLCTALPAHAQTPEAARTLTLDDAIAIAIDSSLNVFRYRNMYQSSYWSYVSYRADRLPSLSLTLTPARYYRYITERYDSESDRDVYREQQNYSASGGLSLTQNVDFLGGTLYADANLEYLNNFGYSNSTQYSSVPFRLGYKQSLLGYNSFRWERRIEPLKFEKAKREFVYNVESVSSDVVSYFFTLALAQVKREIAERNRLVSDTLCRVGEQRFAIAAISQADLLTLQLDAVNARNTLQSCRQEERRAMVSLATYLGLDQSEDLWLALPGRPHVQGVEADKALTLARANNPTYLSQQQSVLEARQTVDKTRKELYVNASVNASVGFNQVSETFSGAFRDLLQQDLVSVSLSIPLVDWGVRRGKLNMAKNNLTVAEISAQQSEQSLEEEVMMTVSDFLAQESFMESAEQAVQLAELAYVQTQSRFMIGQGDVNSLTLAQNRRQTAQENYVTALRDYWVDYYKLRKLTLYDFEHTRSLFDAFDFQSGRYF
jgi:outer membrane protein TolC